MSMSAEIDVFCELKTHLLQLIDGNEGGTHFSNVANDGRPDFFLLLTAADAEN